ncbi:MAG: hypothetical protein IJP71_03795 [Lachnospiraceae bacterium]|nr:hypothetical protein [Lachnospiraceae bacterium]
MSNSNKNIRKVSFDILFEVFFCNRLLNLALNEKFEKIELDENDKSFIKREVTGVIEKIENIDELINKYSKVSTNKLDRDILVVLRLAVYELCYMDKVPAFATINEYVNIVKKSKNSRLSGFVNAILRNIDRKESEKTSISSHSNDKNCYFRIYNDHEESVLKEMNKKNISYKSYDGSLEFRYAKVYSVNKYKDILDLDSFKNGDILIEDASSIFLTDRLAYYIKEREKEIKKSQERDSISMMKLLDACASPGGKILSLIDLIYGDYFYFYAEARDISEEKIFKICENVNRLKVLDLNLNVKDATIHDGLDDDKYDVVLLDVPCTGLGVIDKKPDIKLNYSDEKKGSLVKIQRKILDACKHYVKKGGILSYSTCTETKEENEDNIDHFLSHNEDFEVVFEKKIRRNDENKADGFYMCFLKRL